MESNMMDEDYAYERQRQRRLDRMSQEMDALQILRREVAHKSHHEDVCFQHGFLCIALSSSYRYLSGSQCDFLRQKIHSMLNGNDILPVRVEGNPQLKYLNNEVMFAAMAHAYRLGIVDQWIASQKEKEND